MAFVAFELCENGSAVLRHSSSELRRLGCVCAADRAVLLRGPLWLSDVARTGLARPSLLANRRGRRAL